LLNFALARGGALLIRANSPQFTQGIEGGDLFFHRPSPPLPSRPANSREEISEFSGNFFWDFVGGRNRRQRSASRLFQVTEPKAKDGKNHQQFGISQDAPSRLDLGVGVVGNRPALALQLADDEGRRHTLGMPNLLQLGAEGVSGRFFGADASGHIFL